MPELARLSSADFDGLCRRILAGLGIPKPRDFPAKDVERSYRVELVRESTDKMFRAEETWLCVFARAPRPLDLKAARAIADATIAANVRFLLLVVFGTLVPEAEERLRRTLADQEVHTAVLTGPLAECLAADYAAPVPPGAGAPPASFSFARLRACPKALVEAAPWRKHFQTVSIQPGRVFPLQAQPDAALSESDLVRVLHGGSFLLLGEPGSGKTTSLLALGRDLGEAGPFAPVFLPLGRYQGDFWEVLGEALAPGAEPVAKATARALVESGVLVILLDGLNEVQRPDLHARLVDDLNRLTDPEEPTARSRWIVSGRVYDYAQAHHQLAQLETRRWEMQPLTADLIFQLLADALGRGPAQALYEDLSDSVRDLCSNPLLLNMLLAVHKEQGRAPVGRGALYHQFVDLLLRWGEERHLLADQREALARLWPEPLDQDRYQALARAALTSLASGAATTQIPWREAQREFAAALSKAHDPPQAAAVLLEDLTRRGLLRADLVNRVSFFHHTFQEYFRALGLVGRPVEELIPKGGVTGVDREAVIFAAGLMGNPTPLARRALDVDPALAFEIVRDAPGAVPEDLTRQLAKTLWSRTLAGGRVAGGNRFWAILFRRLAALVGKSVEGLAADVDGQSDENAQINNLMRFYAELGDAQGQARALSRAVRGQDVPESLLFRAGMAAFYSADHQRAVDLYTRYLEKNPRDAPAHNNRALAYEKLGRNDAALADYERAIELEGSPGYRTNYASLLHEFGRKDEALREVRLALQGDPNYALAHQLLAILLESEEPETALGHWEQAVRYALHDEDLRFYLPRLAAIQEKLGRHAEAIRTLRWMIALEPTSAQVKSWKQRIAALRQRLDAAIRAQSARERLHEQGELPLPTLVVEWLKAAGLTVEQPTSGWVLAKPRDAPTLPVLLMPEARVTGRGLREAVESVRAHAWQAPKIVVVTAAETLDLEAHHQWAAMQDEVTLALISALEVRDALLQSDRECRALLDRVLGRSGTLSDPFDYRGVVREPTEFFGRRRDLEDLTARISRGQQVGLYGIHKIGKSSLLERLRRTLHVGHPEITVLQIELDGHGRGPGDFYHRVLERLPGAPDLPSPQSLTSAQFRRRLGEYQQARAKQRPGHRVLLMVDEYPYLIPDTRGESHWPGYLEVLGQLKTLHQEGWFLLLPCGRSAALNRQGSWPEGENPLVGLLHPLFLGPLPREENDALMTTIGLRAHLKFTPEALEAVYAQTAGHPSLSRGLGSQIADAGTGEVTEARVHAAVEKFLRNRDRTTILRAIYEDRMDRDEQQIARTLAIGGARARKDLFPEDADTPRRRQIRDAVENLLDTTVLVQQPDEKIAHRYGLLGRMIQEEARELGQE